MSLSAIDWALRVLWKDTSGYTPCMYHFLFWLPSFSLFVLSRFRSSFRSSPSLSSIICNHSVCLSSVFAILSFEYFVVHRGSEPHFSSSSLSFFFFFFFLSFLLCMSSNFGSGREVSFFLFFLFPFPFRQYHVFHHYCGSQCCYYCFMCSLLACRLAGTDCRNRQLPKILILV